ncbi:MAG: hypothetical protein LW768_19415 [Rubrivivax sp.]|jgi:hypothetical protein|nr:hypothetical protein [Rubrivivax sp.]
MAYTQADLDALDAAILNGELEVQEGDRRVRYRSIPELQAAAAHVRSRLAEAASGSGASRRSVRRFDFTTARGE